LPYQAISKETRAFVSNEYRSDIVTITDPRNMHKCDVETLLRHIYGRQQQYGPASAFRFKLFLDRSESKHPAIYGDEEHQTTNRKKTAGKKKKPAVKPSAKSKQGASTPKVINPVLIPKSGGKTGLPVPDVGFISTTNRADSFIMPDPRSTSTTLRIAADGVINTVADPINEGLPKPAQLSLNNNTSQLIEQFHENIYTSSAPIEKIAKQRKVVNSDALAAEEAKHLGAGLGGNRQRRPRARGD
jgi:hypothetical protein